MYTLVEWNQFHMYIIKALLCTIYKELWNTSLENISTKRSVGLAISTSMDTLYSWQIIIVTSCCHFSSVYASAPLKSININKLTLSAQVHW